MVRKAWTTKLDSNLFDNKPRFRKESRLFSLQANLGGFVIPTSKKVASQAGKDLSDPKTPKKDRAPIASAGAPAFRETILLPGQSLLGQSLLGPSNQSRVFLAELGGERQHAPSRRLGG
jgi:hypothetical protein